MPLRDTAAMNRSLNNDYGATRAAGSPVTHDLALFFGDPLIDVVDGGGVELDEADCPGYARVQIESDSWPAAVDGAKSVSVTFPDTEGEWTTPVTHWGLYGSDGNWWDCGEMPEPLEVTGVGDGPLVVVTVFYDNSLGLDS